MQPIQPKNKKHEQRLKTAANLDSIDLEKLLIAKRQEELTVLQNRRHELNSELAAITKQIEQITVHLNAFGEEPLKNDWEALSYEALKDLIIKERSPQGIPEVARAIQNKYPNKYSTDTTNSNVGNALRALASRGVINKNEVSKTYTIKVEELTNQATCIIAKKK